MSLPTQDFSRLSIGGSMAPETRAQAQRAAGRRSQGQQNRRRREALERQRAAWLANPSGPTIGNSLLQYDLRSITPESRETAVRGVCADHLKASTVRVLDSDSGMFVAIGVFDRKPIRLQVYGPDNDKDGRKITCSCDTFSSKPETVICEHIYWLYDGLNGSVARIPNESVQALDRTSIELRFEQLFGQIASKSDRLPDDLNEVWEYGDDGDYDEEIDDTLKDILAVFDSEKLGDEFDEAFDSKVPTSDDKSFQDLVVRGDLPMTVFSLARHDSIFRGRLERAVSKDIRSEDFLLKLNNRRKRFIQLLDNYDLQGPQLRVRYVSNVALELRGIVERITEYKESHAPLSNDFDIGSAELLTHILRDICTRNKDLYANSSWFQGTPPDAERDRNLFVSLIASPSGQYQGTLFILDFLSDELPQPAYSHLVNRFQFLMEQLQRQHAPEPYLQKLQELITRIQTRGQGHNEPEQLERRFGQQSPVSPGQFRHTIPAEYSAAQSGSAVGASSSVAAAASSSRYARRPSEQDQPDPQRRRLE